MTKLVFVWENFGPMHCDRIDAVIAHFNGHVECIGIEEMARSQTYDWDTVTGEGFEKITLFGSYRPKTLRIFAALVQKEVMIGKVTWFLCNYDEPHVLFFAIYLRLRFRKVYLMACSKFDDKPRNLYREVIKFLILLPYRGVISSGLRSKGYFRLLGLRPVVGEYNSLSTSRIQTLSGGRPAPDGATFETRDFVIVARLVKKKNISIVLHAFSIFLQQALTKRRLIICGSGDLHSELIALAGSLGITGHVVFEGFVQTTEIARILTTSLALILPSTEEQFGNVVIEAQAMGLPVLLSNVCGARDILVRSWVNGFVFEPDNPEGLAYFMGLISSDKTLWEQMCRKATAASELGDAARFAEGVALLTMGKT